MLGEHKHNREYKIWSILQPVLSYSVRNLGRLDNIIVKNMFTFSLHLPGEYMDKIERYFSA